MLQNVLFPLRASGTLRGAEAEERARHFIDKVGIEPDVFVEPEPLPEGEERELQPLDAELDLERDRQLRTAVELLGERLHAEALAQAS